MKPSILDKLLLVLMALLVMAAGCCAVLLAVRAFNAQGVADVVLLSQHGLGYTLLFSLAGIALILLALRVLLVFLARNVEKASLRQSVTVRKGENGMLQISVDALQTMAREYCGKVAGVRACTPEIRQTPGGTALKLHTSFLPEANIPESAAALQQGIKDYLGTTCGVTLSEVDVLVMPQSAVSK